MMMNATYNTPQEEASSSPAAQWPSGLTPLQSAFAEAKRLQQASDRAAQQQRILSKHKQAVRGPCRRISCKARGMSAKHNSDTAFFDVPVDAPHGMLLSCSHAECAGSGKRFRYCVVCEMPFAMRNFLKRHGHGVVQSVKELKDHEGFNDLGCTVIENNFSSPPAADDMSSPSSQESQVVVRRHKRVVSFDKSKTKNALAINGDEQRWLQLLRQRPDTEDQTNMTSWMDMVISYSEQKTSGKKHTSSRCGASSSPVTVMTPSSPVAAASCGTDNMEPLAFTSETGVDDFDFSSMFDGPLDASSQEETDDVGNNQHPLWKTTTGNANVD